MKSIKGAVFDADGTIFDSMYIWENAGSDYLKRKGIIPREELQSDLETMTMEEAALYFREEYQVAEEADAIIEEINQMILEAYENKVKVKPGFMAVLEQFRLRGIAMYIATSTDRPLVEAALKNSGIAGYFQGIITSTEAGAGKKEPLIYELACKRLGTSVEETAVFEDAFFAARTAKGAGFITVGICDNSEKRQEELKELSDLYLKSWNEWRMEG